MVRSSAGYEDQEERGVAVDLPLCWGTSHRMVQAPDPGVEEVGWLECRWLRQRKESWESARGVPISCANLTQTGVTWEEGASAEG